MKVLIEQLAETETLTREIARWECPVCGTVNFARTAIYSWHEYAPIVTPKIYHCRASKCQVKRFFWRETDGFDDSTLRARFVGKYESIDELNYICPSDPIRFYSEILSRPNPIQLTIL